MMSEERTRRETPAGAADTGLRRHTEGHKLRAPGGMGTCDAHGGVTQGPLRRPHCEC